jgi:hypothetical protein
VSRGAAASSSAHLLVPRTHHSPSSCFVDPAKGNLWCLVDIEERRRRLQLTLYEFVGPKLTMAASASKYYRRILQFASTGTTLREMFH